MRSQTPHAPTGRAIPEGEDPADGRQPDQGALSKTRRKRQMLELQALGERLVALGDEKLAALSLPERLLDAVIEARRTRTHEGRRRQSQFIGRLMRDVDPSGIEAALEVDAARHRGAVNAMHAAERWRDGLLDGNLSLTEFVDRHPMAAAAGLPSLVTQARRERDSARPPRQQRALYREIHRLITQLDDAPADGAPADDAPMDDALSHRNPSDDAR